MRSPRCWCGLFAVLAASGCSVDESVVPVAAASALKLSVVGSPRYLTGKVRVRFEAPPASVSHVDFALRGEVVGKADAPPFSFELDSSAFSDGKAELTAKATLAGSGASEGAELAVELANHGPAVTITSPGDGSTVIGSPSHGFTIKPVVSALDGNGIAAIWADTSTGSVDLGHGDGATAITLGPVGTDFPHAAIPLTIHARDVTGAETAVTIKVVPSNVKVRFEQATGGAIAPVSSLDVLADGRALLGFASSYYLLPEPSLTATPSLTLDRVDALVRSSGGLFFTTHDAAMTKESLLFTTLKGEMKTLFDLTSATQATAFDPFLHSSGRVYASWVDSDTLQSHLLAYQADGTPVFDVTHLASPLLDQVAETPDGRLLTMASPPTSVSFVQPFNAATGAEETAWAPPGGQFSLVDAEGVVLLYYTSKAYGTPAIHLASFDASGVLQWDELVDETYPQLVRRLPGGDTLVYLFGAAAGVPSTLTVIGKSGQTPLWTGQLDESNYLLGGVPGSSDLLVSRFNTTTSSLSALRLSASGAVVWVAPLPGDANAAVQLLSDGSVLASAPDAKSGTVLSTVVGPDGKLAWSTSFPGEKVLGALETDDLLIFAASGGDMAPFRFEARSRATGALSWRYLEGPSPEAFGRWVMGESKPWGAILTSLVRAKKATSGMSYTTVTLGLVP